MREVSSRVINLFHVPPQAVGKGIHSEFTQRKLAPEDTRIPNVSRTQSQWTARRDRVSSLVFEGARNEVASSVVVAELRSAVHKGKIQRSHGIGFTFAQGVLVL